MGTPPLDDSEGSQAILQLASCPFSQLKTWLHQAIVSGMKYPTAMTLATLAVDGTLDQRIVLLKHLDTAGLVFFASDNSKKVRDFSSHPFVSVHFPWHTLDRQVRISGKVYKLDPALTTQYFITKPDFEKTTAPASEMEEETFNSSRHFLLKQFHMMQSKFYGGGDRRAGQWSGYRIVPDRFEYWQGGGAQLRERFVYQTVESGAWEILQLSD